MAGEALRSPSQAVTIERTAGCLRPPCASPAIQQVSFACIQHSGQAADESSHIMARGLPSSSWLPAKATGLGSPWAARICPQHAAQSCARPGYAHVFSRRRSHPLAHAGEEGPRQEVASWTRASFKHGTEGCHAACRAQCAGRDIPETWSTRGECASEGQRPHTRCEALCRRIVLLTWKCLKWARTRPRWGC